VTISRGDRRSELWLGRGGAEADAARVLQRVGDAHLDALVLDDPALLVPRLGDLADLRREVGEVAAGADRLDRVGELLLLLGAPVGHLLVRVEASLARALCLAQAGSAGEPAAGAARVLEVDRVPVARPHRVELAGDGVADLGAPAAQRFDLDVELAECGLRRSDGTPPERLAHEDARLRRAGGAVGRLGRGAAEADPGLDDLLVRGAPCRTPSAPRRGPRAPTSLRRVRPPAP
jgi:hypothetical protein